MPVISCLVGDSVLLVAYLYLFCRKLALIATILIHQLLNRANLRRYVRVHIRLHLNLRDELLQQRALVNLGIAEDA